MENGLFWVVIESQLDAEGHHGILHQADDDFEDALEHFHATAASAAQSTIPYHAVFILTSVGEVVRQEIYDRRNLPDERFIDE